MHANLLTPTRASRRPQQGAVAVFTAILIALLVGFGALVVDLGRLYVFKTELQTAMDSCALAASGGLTGANDPNVFNVARARGLAMLDATKTNADGQARAASLLHFQSDGLNLGQVEVEFSEAMNGPWSGGGNPVTTKYVRCRYVDTGVPLLMGRVLNFFDSGGNNGPIGADTQVAAYAVARLVPGQSACAIPIGLCKSGAAPDYGLVRGARYTGVGEMHGTGNFGWLDFSPPAGGAPELADLLMGQGNCDLTTGSPVGAQGEVTSLDRAWNTRFGIYLNSQTTPANATPDYSGYGYPSGGNHYADYMARVAARTPFQGNTGNWTKLSTAEHGQYGKSRRIAVTPIVDCSVWSTGPGSAQPPIEAFGCVLMLAPVLKIQGAIPEGADASMQMAIEYIGRADEPGSPCTTAGRPGGGFGPPVPALVQ